MPNLDTHILLFGLDGSLTCAEPGLLARDPWGTSAIALGEVAKLARPTRISCDPADELIAATSVVHRVPLVKRDRKTRRAKIVPIANA